MTQDVDQKSAGDGADGGEMGALIRALDWSKTPIGPVEGWSPSLRMMVGVMLANRFPLLLWWGPEYAQIYNDAYRPILGRKHPDFLGRPVRECWDEIWHILKPLIDTPFHGGPSTWMDDILLEIRRHDFVEETHFTIAYSPVPDETAPRGIGGVLATVHEITEKVIGERRVVALRDLGARATEAKTAADACAMAAATLAGHPLDVPFALLYLIDPDGRQARLVGAAGWAAAGPPVIGLDGPSADTAAWPLAASIRRDGLVTVDDLDGRFATLPAGPWADPPRRAVVVPVRSSKAGEPAALLVAGVSSRLRLDDQYRSFYELTANQIAMAITNARAYEEERRRAEALAEIDRAKTAFFSNVSHEFRTPLTLMLGPLEDALAAAPETLPQRRDDLALAHRSSLRLLRLVNTLLEFSRIEAGRVAAAYEPVDLAGLTAELASVFRAATEKAGLRLIVDCPALDQPVWVDRDMWEKIVLNLLSNAFKFTLEGTIAVRLGRDDERAVLRVEDTGTGIPAHEIPHLFDRFHRVDGARGRTHEGTGIGLALVQELTRLHGGSVRVDSVLGEGSRFTVAIPLGSAHLPAEQRRTGRRGVSAALSGRPYLEEALRWLPDADPPPASGIERALLAEPPLAATAPAPTDRATVVLADDNADMREYVRHLLGGRYNVLTVPDGEAALAALRREPRPDLLVSDVMMPRLDGFQLLRAVRADRSLADLPVILLSARAGEEASIEGLDLGADDYLVKPFSARELLVRVAKNLEMARIRRTAERAVRDLNETLEHKVAERTRALADEVDQRRQAEMALQQALRLEAIGRLTGGIAHDFNNLLTIVVCQADLIAEASDDPRVVRMAGAAKDAAQRGARLTQQLLSFSGHQQLQPVTVAVGGLLAGVGDLVRRTIGERVTVAITAAPVLWPSRFDPVQFESAILNLAINARDAMPNGGRLAIEAVNTTVGPDAAVWLGLAPADYIAVSVTDTGVGMTPEVQRRAFEPFFTTKDVGRGTGLGLAQIYGFARQSGGAVAIDSALGVGTKVTLYLPRAQAPAIDPPVAAAGAPRVRAPAPRLQGKTILLVEDQDDVRDAVQSSLVDLGYRVVTATDGAAGRRLLEADASIDLLLTDVVMPNGVSGIELARDARRLRGNLGVLLISGYLRDLGGPGADAAALAMLQKPFDKEELAEKVAAALRDPSRTGVFAAE